MRSPCRLVSLQLVAVLECFLCLATLAKVADAQSSTPTGFRALHNFEHVGKPTDIMAGGDGNFYGVTDLSQLFRVTPGGAITIWQPFREDVSTAASSLVRASNGEIYGLVGGSRNYVFHLSSSGEVSTVHEFNANTEGTLPSSLVAGSDGFLYGVFLRATPPADAESRAALFRLSTTGSLSIVHQFVAEDHTGYGVGAPIQGTDGNLYFVTQYGGSTVNGALFRCTRAGVVTVVYSFSGGADGTAPLLLAQASDGDFYVEHTAGDGSYLKALSRITAAGVIAQVHRFAANEAPAALIPGTSGTIYGINPGYSPYASVFKFSSESGFQTIYQFGENEIAAGSLRLSADVLYGIATDRYQGFGFVFRLPVSGSLTRLAEFRDGVAPFGPNGGLVQAPDGTFYGTTTFGGAAGKGTIYKLAPDGKFEVLYEFTAASDGSRPTTLVRGGDGALYGITAARAGRASTLFRLSDSGVFTTLDVAPGAATDDPGFFTLTVGADGVVYGTTAGGDRGFGYVFKLAPDGSPTKLYQFSGGVDGGRPHSLIRATDGNLYGCTSSGGANRAGTLFRVTPSGSLTVIDNFSFGIFAPHPGYALVQGSDGNLYFAIAAESLPPHSAEVGAALVGCTLDGAVIAFRTLSIEVRRLIAGTDGKLYGIFVQPRGDYTSAGPETVFSCTLAGSMTKLYQFNVSTEGVGAQALVQGLDGKLYGTLAENGIARGGAVYQIPPIPTGTLGNISSRANVLSGNSALFAGFIVAGTEAKQVVVRGLGPSLGEAGISGTLADPTLRLFDAAGTEIGANDDWQSEPGIMASGLAPTQTRESAIMRTLAPGSYTATLRGKNDTKGIGLVEVYDVSGATPTSRLANISSRGAIGTSDQALIAGFIVADPGGGFGRVVARAIGPSLSASGVADALQDPTLDLFDANGGRIAFNDNWGSDQAQDINETGIAPTDPKESVIVLSARAGAYTAVVRGVGDSVGIGLVEIYSQQER